MPADGFLAADLMFGFRRARCSFANNVSSDVCTRGSGIADYQPLSFAIDRFRRAIANAGMQRKRNKE
jgi:hypothetical protein